jgi:signal transduction histidine kinase
MPREWVAPLQDLYDYLALADSRLELLRYIDEKTRHAALNPLSATCDIQGLLNHTTTRLTQLTGADRGSLYLHDSTELLRAFTTDDLPRPPTISTALLWRPEQAPELAQPFVLTTNQDSDSSLHTTLGAKVILYFPVPNRTNDPLAYIFLESNIHPVNSPLVRVESQDTVSMIALQLSNTIHFYNEARRSHFQLSTAKSFFDGELEPTKSFNSILDHVRAFLPSLGPLDIKPAPEAQLLLHKADHSFLRIIGSTAPDIEWPNVSIDASACGLLIRDRSLPYYLLDPKDDPNYRAYLGANMRSELAIPMSLSGGATAILNLESPNRNAFHQRHIRAMQEACALLRPMFDVFSQFVDASIYAQRVVIATTEQYLSQLIQTLKHECGNPLSIIGVQAQLLDMRVGKESEATRALIQTIQRNVARIDSNLDDFNRNVSGYSKPSRIPIRALVKDVVAKIEELNRSVGKYKVEFDVRNGAEIEVYCSGFVRRHIHEFLENAVYWIGRRIETVSPTPPGKITVTIRRDPLPPGRTERNLNKRCRIVIRDNGTGASAAELEKINHGKRFTGRGPDGGTGVGVQAAREYLQTVSGELEVLSRKAEYFEVHIILEEWNPVLHSGAGSDDTQTDQPARLVEGVNGVASNREASRRE